MELHRGSGIVSWSEFKALNNYLVSAPNTTSWSTINNGIIFTLLSGKTQEAVLKLIEDLKSNKKDLVSLIERSMSDETLNTVRGYSILNGNKALHEIMKCDEERPDVWFIFPGLGSQWHGMGKVMMERIPQFRSSIMKCSEALQQYEFSLIDLLTETDENTLLSSPINSLTSVTAIQIALIDLLWKCGIQADGMIGHSAGELVCAYTDGSLTAQQTIQAAYLRGRCIEEANLPPAAMASVGITWQQAKKCCPGGIVPACHNTEHSVTIAGPVEPLYQFVEQLQSEGVFARPVNVSGVAFHSYLLQPCVAVLEETLAKVIPVAKPRNKKWISTSVPQDKWNEEYASYSSALYHVNNLLNPVLFSEALKHIPSGSVIIEVGSHGLFGLELEQECPGMRAILSLMKRNHEDNYNFFLKNLGRCFLNGLSVDVSQLQS